MEQGKSVLISSVVRRIDKRNGNILSDPSRKSECYAPGMGGVC